ncbi:hypothetical protein BKA82DRAFT_4015526 [Pisolithus tinctorius]|nr:hypothetical protein BKA82DRAFT_4015526 [Pisolithus tinctorius]
MAGIQNGGSELRALSKTVGQQSVTIEKLMTCLQTVEEEVAILCAWMETQQDDCLESSRGRRAMKLYIHPLFADLCGIERSLERGARVLTLMHVKPLDTCEPFEQIDQKTHVWHPNFLGQVDDAQNAKFIQEVAQHIWDDETTWCQQTGKGELPDSDYSMPIIKEYVKLLDGADWLDGFYSQLQEGDLLKEDAKYLSELVKWKEHKEHENNADQSDVE